MLVPSEYSIAALNRESLKRIGRTTVHGMGRHQGPRRAVAFPLYLALRHVLKVVFVLLRLESTNNVELLACATRSPCSDARPGVLPTSPPIAPSWPSSVVSSPASSGLASQ
jgi:hypothetical protein